jgi:drug/metabolite transporter (DMT)-like permease
MGSTMIAVWRLDAFGVNVCNSLSTTFDKVAIGENLSNMVSGYLRLMIYMMLVIPVCWLIGEPIQWFMSPIILILGAMQTFNSGAYSILINRLNPSAYAALSYGLIVVYYLIDYLAGDRFTTLQMVALVGTLIGAALFTMESKPKVDLLGVAAFLWMAICYGSEAYYGKYIHATQGTPIIVVETNSWGWAAFFQTLWLVGARKTKELSGPAVVTFVKWSFLGKLCEVFLSILWCWGLVTASVSQMYAMNAMVPLTTVFVAGVFQFLSKRDVGESLQISTMLRKILASILLITSSFFV